MSDKPVQTILYPLEYSCGMSAKFRASGSIWSNELEEVLAFISLSLLQNLLSKSPPGEQADGDETQRLTTIKAAKDVGSIFLTIFLVFH